MKKEDVKSTLYHEIQHLVQEKEGFARGTSIEAASEYGTKQLDKLEADRAEYFSKNKKELDKIDAERKANDDAHKWETDEDYDEWFRADEALSAREKEIKKAVPRIDWNDLDAVNLYQRQGGEAEARNVEARLHSLTDNMPHPFDTLDIDRAKRVNLNGEGVSESVKPSNIKKNMNAGEIWRKLIQWRTSKSGGQEKILVSRISDEETAQLQKEFKFKGNYPLAREIRDERVSHTLKEHGDPSKEAKRGQIAVNLHDIAHYQEYIAGADLRVVQNNNRILYAKQVDKGHYVVIEEVMTGQNKLGFFDMWKVNGKMNKQTLTQRRTSEAD